MTQKQLRILNSLVTFAAENVPGGLSPDESEVARIVGAAALIGDEEALNAKESIPCTCSLASQDGDPEDHGNHCLWAIAQVVADD